jgi:predicted secreted Zn-dependent protease
MDPSLITFLPSEISAVPPSYTPFNKTKYVKPNLAEILNNSLGKTWSFYWQGYYRHDLKRVCEAEEMIQEWFDLCLKPNFQQEWIYTLE